VKREIAELREALLDLAGVMNRPQPDAALIKEAGIDLDRALFPLLTRIELKGPLAIGELAELCGRDYTTVSRQVTKLVETGLIIRQSNPQDARITEVVVTKKGRDMTQALDHAREKIFKRFLAHWDKEELSVLARLLRKLADDALEFVRAEKKRRP
jgi:DNA-binding MarR family transcriptional regulator